MLGKILLMLILLCSMVSAATIQGNVYDISLELQDNVVVEVDSQPKQTVVAKEGSYSLELPDGHYTITAKRMVDGMLLESAEEEIDVKGEGTYTLDLILFESFEEDEALLEEDIEVDTSAIEDEQMPVWPFIAAALILAAAILIVFLARKKPKHNIEDPYMEKMVAILKREGGRATQKEIRKSLGISEAKVSLMVAQLEHEGKIKKIKKGRGNIIILT